MTDHYPTQDLYFAKESLQLSLGQTRLELAKAREIATKIREFCRWKNVNCPYEKNPAIADFLLKSPVLEDEGKAFFFELICTVRTRKYSHSSNYTVHENC